MKREDLQIGDLVKYSKIFGGGIGEITGFVDNEICLVDGQHTWFSDIFCKITAESFAAESTFIKGFYTPEQRRRIEEYIKHQPKTVVIEAAGFNDFKHKLDTWIVESGKLTILECKYSVKVTYKE